MFSSSLKRDDFFNFDEKVIEEKIKNSEIAFEHPSYILEKKLSNSITNCNIDQALFFLEKINSLERAQLSNDPLRSIKNSLIVSCSIYTRAIISGGLDSESAFILSDIFIRQIETIQSIDQCENFERNMLVKFIEILTEVKNKHSEEDYLPIISKTRAYIRRQSIKKLTLSEIADYVNVHPNYLSALFSKECNKSITSYYDEVRTETIIHYLEYTEMSISEIAILLDFSSFSHFSSFFKKQTGQSPSEYRKKILK